MALYNPHFSVCDFRNPNRPTPLRTNWPQYTAERGEYMGLSSNMTVRYKMRPNKMALWNVFLPSLGETVKPTTRSDVLTTTRKADDKKGITIESKNTKYTACISFDFMCFFFLPNSTSQIPINQMKSIESKMNKTRQALTKESS